MKTTRITLIRHGEVAADAVGTHYGSSDVDLGDQGRAQSLALVERLADEAFDAIWASDLVRATWLAERLAAPRSLEVRCDAAFRERDVGAFEGMTYAEAERAFPDAARLAKEQPGLHRPPDGENLDDLRARVMPAFERLVLAHPEQRVALVCHGGPIRVVLGTILGVPNERLQKLRISHCSRSVVSDASGRRRVESINAI